jgi:hypothetical protein
MWWIATDLRRHGGDKLLGPFVSRDLALDVRGYVEKVNHPTTYAVDEWPDDTPIAATPRTGDAALAALLADANHRLSQLDGYVADMNLVTEASDLIELVRTALDPGAAT